MGEYAHRNPAFFVTNLCFLDGDREGLLVVHCVLLDIRESDLGGNGRGEVDIVYKDTSAATEQQSKLIPYVP